MSCYRIASRVVSTGRASALGSLLALPRRPTDSSRNALSAHSAPARREGRAALLYFGSHRLRGNRFGPARFRASPCANNAIYSSTLRVRSALSIEGWDFEEEKSLDSAGVALAAAAALAGCGKTYYFAGRVLPPSGLINRVMIAIQNPGILAKGALEIVDAFYDSAAATTARRPHFPSPAMAARCPSPSRTCPRSSSAPSTGRATAASPWSITQAKRPSGTVSGLNGTFVQHLHYPQSGTTSLPPARPSHVFTVVNQAGGSSTRSEPSRRLPRQREPRRLGGAGLRPELQLRLLSAPALDCADHSLIPAAPPPGPRPPSTASRRMRPPGACSRCKAPTTSTQPATTMALRWPSTARSRLSSRPTAAPPIS